MVTVRESHTRRIESKRSPVSARCARRVIGYFSAIAFGISWLAAADSPSPPTPILKPAWVGLRTGFSATRYQEMFYETDVLAGWRLPWSMGDSTRWGLESGMEFSAGWLTTGAKHGAVGTIGVGLGWRLRDLPLQLTGGTGVTWISRHRFEDRDFGMPFQFTSHIGFAWEIGPRIQLGYRFQHMSNAGLARSNPGLDLHALTIRYRL
jgi:hypothetical protein